jgi:phage virion morphogenesis protein
MITLEVNSQPVLAMLQRIMQAGVHLRPALEDIGDALENAARLTFVDQVDPYGHPWAPLSPVTLERRRKAGAGAQILRDTGRLANSLTYVASDTEVLVGTNVIYAGTHEFGAPRGSYGATRRGSPIPWGDVPARQFLPDERGLPPDQEADVLQILTRYLDTAMRGA